MYCERSTNESLIPLSVFISVRPNLVQLDLAAINKLTSAILVSRSFDLLGFGFFPFWFPLFAPLIDFGFLSFRGHLGWMDMC
jgi:hypothetical protein